MNVSSHISSIFSEESENFRALIRWFLTLNKGKHGSLCEDIDIFSLHGKNKILVIYIDISDVLKYNCFQWKKSLHFTESYFN